MFMPTELTRMMREDPEAFDALMKQRRAESQASMPDIFDRFMKERGGNIFNPSLRSPEEPILENWGRTNDNPRITQGPAPVPGLGNKIEDFLSTLDNPYWKVDGTEVTNTDGTPIMRTPYPEAPGRTNSSFGDLTPHPSITTPNVRTKIEEYLSQMDDSGGLFPWNDFDKFLGRPGSRPEDRIKVEEQWGNTPGPAVTEPTIPGLGPGYGKTPPMQTPPAEVPTPPLEVERYPSGIRKDDPRYDRETGKFNLVYIPEFDDPNYQEGVKPRGIPESAWNWMQRQKSGGEGVQYRM